MDHVTRLWSDSGRQHRRVEEILDLPSEITWGLSEDGRKWSHYGGPKDSEIRVVVLESEPAPETELVVDQAFQAGWGWRDEAPTVYVGRAGYTTLWAGIVLCHELDHALEYLEGISEPGESRSDWDSAEGRVFRNKAVLLDAITRGRFSRR